MGRSRRRAATGTAALAGVLALSGCGLNVGTEHHIGQNPSPAAATPTVLPKQVAQAGTNLPNRLVTGQPVTTVSTIAQVYRGKGFSLNGNPDFPVLWPDTSNLAVGEPVTVTGTLVEHGLNDWANLLDTAFFGEANSHGYAGLGGIDATRVDPGGSPLPYSN